MTKEEAETLISQLTCSQKLALLQFIEELLQDKDQKPILGICPPVQ